MRIPNLSTTNQHSAARRPVPRTLLSLLLGLVLATPLVSQTSTQPGGNPSRNRGFVPQLRFTVYFKSMQPETISIPEGPYDIQINSGILQSAVEYNLEEQGKAEKRIDPNDKDKGRQLIPVDLKPGTYTLSVNGFADRWRSVIVVTKK